MLQLPWYSPGSTRSSFPPRATARRRRQNLNTPNDALALPYHPADPAAPQQAEAEEIVERTQAEEPASETSTIAALSERETPATSQAPSESDYTQVSTPTTPAQAAVPSPKPTPTQVTQTSQHVRRDTRTAIAVPNIPSLPKSKGTPPSAEKQPQETPPSLTESTPVKGEQKAAEEESAAPVVEEPKAPAKPAAPKSWADLVRTKNAIAASAQQNGVSAPNGVASLPKSASLAEALRQYSVANERLAFLEPRGLVNTGNMCYMNSVSRTSHLTSNVC